MPHNPPKYIDITQLLLSLQHDPDLASLHTSHLEGILQQLYIVTGCDYVSYTAKIGKATFLNIFFQHANFICDNQDLSMTESNDTEQGFLTLVCRLGYETPRQLFNSITNMNHKEKHKEWYLQIRKVVPVLTEEQRPPTVTALWKHWQ